MNIENKNYHWPRLRESAFEDDFLKNREARIQLRMSEKHVDGETKPHKAKTILPGSGNAQYLKCAGVRRK